MIDRSHDLPITSQAKALNISRSSVYYLPRAVPAADLAIMGRMDELHLDFPFAGSRMIAAVGLSAAYERVLTIQVETIERRAAAGLAIGLVALDVIANRIRRAVHDGVARN